MADGVFDEAKIEPYMMASAALATTCASSTPFLNPLSLWANEFHRSSIRLSSGERVGRGRSNILNASPFKPGQSHKYSAKSSLYPDSWMAAKI